VIDIFLFSRFSLSDHDQGMKQSLAYLQTARCRIRKLSSEFLAKHFAFTTAQHTDGVSCYQKQTNTTEHAATGQERIRCTLSYSLLLYV